MSIQYTVLGFEPTIFTTLESPPITTRQGPLPNSASGTFICPFQARVSLNKIVDDVLSRDSNQWATGW